MGGMKDLFGDTPVESADSLPHFDGETYDPSLDHKRLGAQYLRTFNLMKDEKWRTLDQISVATGDPAASVSARMRDFRKEKFGGHDVQRVRRDSGLFFYRLVVNLGAKQ